MAGLCLHSGHFGTALWMCFVEMMKIIYFGASQVFPRYCRGYFYDRQGRCFAVAIFDMSVVFRNAGAPLTIRSQVPRSQSRNPATSDLNLQKALKKFEASTLCLFPQKRKCCVFC